jgi:hypothetical protein
MEEEWPGPPKDAVIGLCPGCVVAGWMVGVLAAMVTFSLILWLGCKGAHAFGASFFALIATVPLLLVRALFGRGRGLVFATSVGAGFGLLYSVPFHAFFEPMTLSPDQYGNTVGLAFVASGAVAGSVWWGCEWLLKQ